MKMSLTLPLAATLCVPTLALAQTATYEEIPMSAYALDMSADGRYIVGATDTDGDGLPDGSYVLDCETSNVTILPPSNGASAVSDDGTVVLGNIGSQLGETAAIWTQATGWTSLGALPNAGQCPGSSSGYELSADGTVAVGLSWDGCSGRAFRWTQADDMVEMQVLGSGGNRASTCSADGTILGGFAQGSFSRTPTTWDGTTATGELLDPPGGDVVGEVLGMSDDGTILLGNWDGDAYMWTEADGVQILGAGSLAQSWVGIAMDIADNGMIVGFDTLIQSRRGWVKPVGEDDLVPLSNYVLDHGGTLPPGIGLAIVTRISADGRTIIGHDFFQTAWKITLEYCAADIAGPANGSDGNVDSLDFLALIAQWGTPCVGTCTADITGPGDVPDGNVDALDYLLLISQWGSPANCID